MVVTRIYNQTVRLYCKAKELNVKIADELFVINPNHFMKICDLLIERNYGFNIWPLKN